VASALSGHDGGIGANNVTGIGSSGDDVDDFDIDDTEGICFVYQFASVSSAIIVLYSSQQSFRVV